MPRHVVVWGANPTVSNTHFPPLVQQARAAGARLTVVDPRRTAMAARADRHVAPLPGTDVVLALAMARHLSAPGAARRRLPRPARQRRRGAAGRRRPLDARCRGRHLRRGRGRHRGLRRGVRRAPSVVPARGMGHRTQPQRWLVVQGGARPPGAGRPLRCHRQWRDDEPVGRGAAVDAARRSRWPGRASATSPAEHEPPRPAAVRRARRPGGGRAVRVGRQPCGDVARPGPCAARAGSRRPLHRRARAGDDRHRGDGRRRAPRDDALRGRRPGGLLRLVHHAADAPGDRSGG